MKPRASTAARGRQPSPPAIFSPVPPQDAGAGIPGHAGPTDPELRRAMIAEAAYYRAEQRGFEPGRELEDWCAAECDIDSRLSRTPAVSTGAR